MQASKQSENKIEKFFCWNKCSHKVPSTHTEKKISLLEIFKPTDKRNFVDCCCLHGPNGGKQNWCKVFSVAVDDSSKVWQGEIMKTKTAIDTTPVFKEMDTKVFMDKVLSDKTEFRGVFEQQCDSKKIEFYITNCETYSAFAQQGIRLLKKNLRTYRREMALSLYH